MGMENSMFDRHRSAYFDDLSDKWDSLGPPPPDIKIKAFLNKLDIKPGDAVLDLGTGTGLLIPYIFEYHPLAVIAADLSAKMLDKVKAKYSARFGEKLSLLQTDVHNLNLPDQSVTGVICNGAFPHFYDKSKALAEIFRVLQSGGFLAINHFSGKNFINSIHGESSNPLIRGDLLDNVELLADQVNTVGFSVHEAIDNDSEYCLVAIKP